MSIFVGRQRELDILLRKLETTFAGRGGLAMLAGEAGIGKTRLAEQLTEHADRLGAAVLRGGCFEGDWQPPYGPWVEALGGHPRAADPEWLRRELGPAVAPLARLLPQVGSALPDTPTAAALTPDEERFRLFDAVARLLLAASKEAPVLLMLDDLQWADPDSLRLLRHCSRFAPRAPLLLLGAYRDPDLDHEGRRPLWETVASLRRETGYDHVVVRGLGSGEVAEYLDRALGQPLPPCLARAIHTETDGNPFYVREILLHLQEEGKLPGPESRAGLSSGEGSSSGGRGAAGLTIRELGVPEGVRQVVDRRVSRLREETAAMLDVAAGFAGGFEFPVLRALTELPEETLLDSLDEALAAGFLRVARTGPPTYDFSHAILRHALYSRLNPDRQVRLHRRIAAALEWVYAGRESDHAPELASQYRASAALPGATRGIPHALAAAEQSRARYAYEQSAAFLRMARDLSAESPPRERAEIQCRLAIAEAEALLLDEARRSAEEAMSALAEVGAESTTRAGFLAQAARVLKDGGAAPSLWEPLADRGLALAGDRRDLTWARLTLLRGRYAPAFSGAPGLGRWLGHDPRAVAVARAEGDEDDYARTLDSPDRAGRADTEAFLDLAHRWQRPSAAMAALNVAARDLFYRYGAFQEAVTTYLELLAVAERHGAIPEQAEALAQLAVARAVLGEIPQARETAARARETVARLGPAHSLHFIQAALEVMLAYHLDGDWTELAAAAVRFAGGREQSGIPYRTVEVGLAASAIAAFAHGRAGEGREARRLLAELTPMAEQMEPSAFAQNSVVTIAAAAVWELEAVEYAATYHRLALDLVSAGVGNGPVGPHPLAVARMASLLGSHEEAAERFEQARRDAESAGLRPGRAIADYDEAMALLRAPSADRARLLGLLESALSAFVALGMEGWARRALELRRRASISTAGETQSDPALSESSPTERRSAPAHEIGALTPRERQVAALIARGLSNADIAAELVISIRTAEAHVANILGKLGFSSRSQVAAWAAKQDGGT